MSECLLHCPRCGVASPKSVGHCLQCGLEMNFSTAPPRSAHLKNQRRVTRIPVAAKEEAHSKPDAAADLNFPGVQTTRPTDQGSDESYLSATGHTAEYQVGKRSSDPPMGGEVAVGTMAEFLLDPSDNPHDKRNFPSMNLTLNGSKLDLAPSKPIEKKDAAEDRSAAAPADEKGETMSRSSPKPAVRPQPGEEPEEVEIRMPIWTALWKLHWDKFFGYLLPRLIPLLVLLFIVVGFGPGFIKSRYYLAGPYKAVFKDNEGRSVNCTTDFQTRDGNPYHLEGQFKCQLYPTRFSMERIDDPKVLKPIMGDGTINYIGKYNKQQIALTLGSLREDDPRTVTLNGAFESSIKKIGGTVSSSLGGSAAVEILRMKKGEE